MASYHKWDIKNDFAYGLQFFSLISDGLSGVTCKRLFTFSSRNKLGNGCQNSKRNLKVVGVKVQLNVVHNPKVSHYLDCQK